MRRPHTGRLIRPIARMAFTRRILDLTAALPLPQRPRRPAPLTRRERLQ